MKASGIGGQAVMEGIMMKNGDTYAVAVRKPDKEIIVKQDVDHSYQRHEKIRKIPFVRGVFNFIDSLVLGMTTLTYSAEFYEEDEEPSKVDSILEKIMGGFGEKFMMGATVALSIILAVAIFMICPFLLAKLFESFIVSPMVLSLVEGLIRVGILLGYILLISRIDDIQRVFMYHGAEHKCINCIEHGMELNVENVMKSSREHKRCGTSFLLVVMLVSIIFFLFIRVDSTWLRLVLRILLVPVIAGVSYEFIRLAGKSESKVVDILSKPGMLLQRLTTSEPDESMVEVAIKAVEAVFDWKAFLAEFTEDEKEELSETAKKTENEEVASKGNAKTAKKTAESKLEAAEIVGEAKAEALEKVEEANTEALEMSESAKSTEKTSNKKSKKAARRAKKKAKAATMAEAEKAVEVKETEAAREAKADVKIEESKQESAKEAAKAKVVAEEQSKEYAEKNVMVGSTQEDSATAMEKESEVIENSKTDVETKSTTTQAVEAAKFEESKVLEKTNTQETQTVAETNSKAMDSTEKEEPQTQAAENTANSEDITIPEYAPRDKKEVEETSTQETSLLEDNKIKAPRLTSVDDSEPGVIKLTWDKVKKVSGYVVYRKAEDEVYKMYPDIKKNYFEDRDIEPRTTYYYRVRAYVIKNNKRVYGQLSPIESNGYNSRIKSKY